MRGSYTSQRLFSRLLMFWAAATGACTAAPYTANNSPSSFGQQSDGLLVKFKPHVDQQQAHMIAKSYGAREVLPLSTPQQQEANSPMAQWHHLRFDRNTDLQQIMQRIAQDPGVVTVELNEVVTIQKQ